MRNLQLAELLRSIGQRHGRTAGEVAIAWTLSNPNVTAAIVGARNAGQVQGTFGAGNLELSQDDLDEIDRFVAAQQ